MTYAYSQYPPLYQGMNLPKLQRDIIERSGPGTITYSGWHGPEITAPLASIANAVESAYVLVEKATLPKVTHAHKDASARKFYFEGEPWAPYSASVAITAEKARKNAAGWLSVARFLDVEEQRNAAEAKRKADADKAEAERARHNRLNDIADLYFGKDFDELGDNKASAVKEIYRLEEQLKTDTDEQDAA